MSADHLVADRAYDTNAILEQAASQGMHVVIPPKKNRTVRREYDEDLYKLRHLVENAFLHLKRWRRHRHTIRQTLSFLPRCRANPMHRPLGQHLVTTLSN